MKRGKGKHLLWGFLLLFFLLGRPKPVAAQLALTQEEIDYINEREVIVAASIDGGAPLHYRNSKGEITGIAVKTLSQIGEMTGLVFEYQLYESIEDVFKSNADVFFGLTPKYAPEGMILSHPYLKAETILFMNSALDPNQLENKRYGSIKGGELPPGIKEENTIFYNSREDVLNAVEKGQVDYGYGNEYSIAFYRIQNGYKNIHTIPKTISLREYAIGFPEEDQILISIINKAIDGMDENQMNQLILEMASQIERKLNFSTIMDQYGIIIISLALIVIAILAWGIFSNIQARKNLSLKNKRYALLAHISNEHLFEYYVKTKKLELFEKSIDLFGIEENRNAFKKRLDSFITMEASEEENDIIRFNLENGETGIFKICQSIIYDDSGKIYSIIGKLINISAETAEKEKLILKSQIDGLTGLYNNVTIKKFVDENIKNRKNQETDALMLMDCDNFKNINDRFGHLEGDRALKNVSKALKNNFREGDIIGRIGGDEFCVYLKNIPSTAFVHSKGQELIRYVQVMDKDFNLTLSIGIAYLKDEKTHKALFKKADDALYEAKQIGKATIVIAE